jgi:hypothetical protein
MTVALEVSCGNCLFAFVVRKTGITDAPLQSAHDNLTELRAGLKTIAHGTGRNSSDDETPERAKIALMPRPAPDPRARKR